jgi:predicted ferric reductase
MQVLLLSSYALVSAGPALLSYIAGINLVDGGWVYEAGQLLSLIAFPIFALQPLLAARLKIADRAFGLDRVMRFHRTMAIAAGLMILLHPILLAAGLSWWALLFGFDLPWYILLGKAALLLVILIAASSLLIRSLKVAYEKWRGGHNILALLIVAGGFVHSLIGGSSLSAPPMQIIWAALLITGIGAQFYSKALRPGMLKKRPFRVSAVRRENDSVCTLAFSPVNPEHAIDFDPGQFQFISLPAGGGSRREEHPFTISSAAEKRGTEHTATIKALGDFTSRIPSTPVGTEVLIQGPFGLFSYRNYPMDDKLCFIAGGIGITPLMSMLRTLHEEKSGREVLLLFGSRSESDIVFGKELEDIAESGFPRLRTVHVIRSPGENWKGRRGFIDAATIREQIGEEPGKYRFFICGPPVMMRGVTTALRGLGVTRSRIHFERFAL